MAHLHEPNPIPYTLSLSVPDHDPCPLAFSSRDSLKAPVRMLWPSSLAAHPPSPLPLILWPEIPAPGREKGREDFKVSARPVPHVDDLLHVWKMVCLSRSRGLSHKSWWGELSRFSITPSSEAP